MEPKKPIPFDVKLFGSFHVHYPDDDFKTIRATIYNESKTQKREVNEFYMHPKSDNFDNKSRYIGFVIYSLGDDATEWYKNSVHVKPGMIYIVKSDKIEYNEGRTMHEKAFRNLFGHAIDVKKVHGSGFARDYNIRNVASSGLTWKYNSYSFNAPSKSALTDSSFVDIWRDTSNKMHPNAIKSVNMVLKYWENGRNRSVWSYYRSKTDTWESYDAVNQKYIEKMYLLGRDNVTLTKGAYNKSPLNQRKYEIHFKNKELFSKFNFQDYKKARNNTGAINTYFVQWNKTWGCKRTVRRRLNQFY